MGETVTPLFEPLNAVLRDYDLSEEEIEAYATTFLHKGKFVLIKADEIKPNKS